MKKRIGPKRRKGGSGLIGMGRGDLAQGGGMITRKLPSTKAIQEKNDKVSIKAVKRERATTAFSLRARAAKATKADR